MMKLILLPHQQKALLFVVEFPQRIERQTKNSENNSENITKLILLPLFTLINRKPF